MQLQRAEAHLAKVVATQQRVAHTPPIREIEEIAPAELHHLSAGYEIYIVKTNTRSKVKEKCEMERELIRMAIETDA